MSNNIVASVTRAGRYEPFNLQVARGQIMGHSIVSIFGYQTNITSTTAPQNSSIPVWENAVAYVYPTTASTMSVASSSATDAGAQVLINGLDANFSIISETVTLTSGTVTTVNSYFRINGLLLTKAASGQKTNVGTITVKQSSNIVAQISIGIGKSQAAIYTVPAGYEFYLDQVEVNTDNGYGGSAMYYNVLSTNNNTGVTFDVLQQAFTSIFSVDRNNNPFYYAPKSDIQWQIATNNSSAVQVGVIVTGKLIQANNNVTGVGT